MVRLFACELHAILHNRPFWAAAAVLYGITALLPAVIGQYNVLYFPLLLCIAYCALVACPGVTLMSKKLCSGVPRIQAVFCAQVIGVVIGAALCTAGTVVACLIEKTLDSSQVMVTFAAACALFSLAVCLPYVSKSDALSLGILAALFLVYVLTQKVLFDMLILHPEVCLTVVVAAVGINGIVNFRRSFD